MDAEKAVEVLLEGNRRYVTGALSHPRRDITRRQELLEGQNPIAALLSCSDSRVPPEIIFDQGLGDLFVVRTAGNVAGDTALGSLEYAVEHLKVPLILVLGHEKCGAVTAAVRSAGQPAHAGAIAGILEKIAPSIEISMGATGDLVENSTRLNAIRVARDISSRSAIISGCLKQGRLVVSAAYYHLHNGEVHLLPTG